MMKTFRCGRESLEIRVPDDAVVYESEFPKAYDTPANLVLDAVHKPVSGLPLASAFRTRRPGRIVVVVSDFTRSIPYATFLPNLLKEFEAAGIVREEILILIATGMHRPSTAEEREEMLGTAARRYQVVDHRADDEADLVELPGHSYSGAAIRLNRHFVDAGFRITTGLVEPHFMAGFSGGAKAVCPGLAALETIQNFHGFAFLADEKARSGILEGNPLYEEALSVANKIGVDFDLELVLDDSRKVVKAFAGELKAAHLAAADFVKTCTCPQVAAPADVVLTSSGGYPLDATFYQCVKGMVNSLPAVKSGGKIIAFGGCSEGIGSEDYSETMKTWSGRWEAFLKSIKNQENFVKDQWQLQMQTRALTHVGQQNLHFVTDGLSHAELAQLSVTGHDASAGTVGDVVQRLVDDHLKAGLSVAVLPEGPFCAPLLAQTASV